jgi:iron complex outermembrane receptor protein
VLTASTTGDLFTLPFGKAKGAFGAEIRRNFIDDTPSDVMSSGDFYNYSSATQTRGSDEAKDVFAEVEIPLLKNLPGAEELTVNGSIRRADYRSYGSGVTHKFGALYSPVKWLSLRASDGTSYRAPALFEQYVGATTGFLASTGDPCNTYEDKNSATLAANCAAEGIAPGFNNTNSITDITSGGRSSGLKAETSKNVSLGLVLQPTLPTGYGDLQFSLDHFNIRVNNGIDRAGVANILDLCYNDPDFRTGGGYCRLVTRDPGTNALTVNDSYVNLATNLTRGNDYNFRYTNAVGIGTLDVKMQATQFLTQASKLFSGDAMDDVNGNIGSPKWSGELDTGYKIKNWGATWTTEFVGKTNSYGYLEEDPATSQYKFKTPNYFLHSLSVNYEDPVGKWKALVGIRNVFDKNPPKISSGYYDKVGNAPLYSGYDFFGRSFFASVSKSF